MKLLRRQFLHLAVGAAALPATSRIARAQIFPSRPVRIVVGFGAGGTPDIIARLMGQWLSEQLGQQFIIENRPGAGSNMGIQAVVRSPPDGYTLLYVTSANAINATLYEKLNFSLLGDIVPIASIVRTPSIMVVNPSLPTRTVPEFIAYAKANPGKLNMASTGIGNLSHVSGELFKMMTGVDMVHVPYRGSAPAQTDLLAGQVQVMFETMPAVVGQIRSGNLRALAVTSKMRSDALPELPAMNDFVPGYEASGVGGIGAPKGTKFEIIEGLNRSINAGIADAKLRARFAELGADLFPGSPADFGKIIADETEKWAKVIKFAGIQSE